MKILRYIFRSFSFYKRQNLALLAGTILSTMVITGALIVGDSVQFSLGRLADMRLGKIDQALIVRDRFVTDSLARRLSVTMSSGSAGVLEVNGLVINPDSGNRIPEAEILGVDSSFWTISGVQPILLDEEELGISRTVSDRLQVNAGDEILIRIQPVDEIPVNAPFAAEKEPSISLRMKVGTILETDHLGRFSLQTNQKAPYNIFISKHVLQQRLKLGEKINLVLLAGDHLDSNPSTTSQKLKEAWTLLDAGLSLRLLPDKPISEVTSNRIFLDHPLADKIIDKYHPDPVLTYLVNAIQFRDQSTPYSFVAGLPRERLGDLALDEVILNDWCANDLGVQIGDSITLEYFVIGPYRKLISESKKFVVKTVQPNQGELFQQDLMPDFPGLSDAKSCSEWNAGIPIDLTKIRDKDEAYWNEFKGTPKAIISIESATRLWSNAYGQYTALRFANGKTNPALLTKTLQNSISPEDIGLELRAVRQQAKNAVENAVDFGELFLSLSFFVIASGLLLLILLYALNILSRKKEIGILKALGLPARLIMRLFLGESIIAIVLGGILGVTGGIFYNRLILAGLNSIWQGAVRTEELQVHIVPSTIFIGFFAGVVIAILAVYFLLRSQIRASYSQSVKSVNATTKLPILLPILAWATSLLSFSIVVYSLLTAQWQNSTLFLSAGALAVFSLVAFMGLWLGRMAEGKGVTHLTVPGLPALAIRNLSRNRGRSVMAVALLALGTFSVVITGANRQTFFGEESARRSGTGGYLYWVETSLPITVDPNTSQGRESYNLTDETLMDSLIFMPLLTLDGDDASCLNLNQVENPQLLGVKPVDFDRRQSFSFAKLMPGMDPDHPWLGLSGYLGENIIPAYLDQTVITWGIQKKIGDTLLYRTETGEDLKLVIAGGLNNSIFQGNVLVAESHLRQYFPSVAGAKVMLVDGDKTQKSQIEEMLSGTFRDYGIDYQLTSERMQLFNSVSNTYLNVFMLLGTLGLLIGTLGFGIILLRNRQERLSETALLTALGISKSRISGLFITEHLVLLGSGLGMGVGGAIIGILPSIVSPAFTMPTGFMVIILMVILVSGLFWIWLAARIPTGDSPVQALWQE